MSVDDLWYLADEADQQAEQTYHRLTETYDGFLEFTTHRTVSRPRFRTVGERILENGLPYGAHTIVYRPSGHLLLGWHDDVDKWVLPGGEVEDGEAFREAARRELHEEASIDAEYDGLGMLGRVEFHNGTTETWGVLPIYEAKAESTDVAATDPDDEITAVEWFGTLPEDARDRAELERWRASRFD